MLRWILRVLGVEDEPDPVWKPTGYTYRHTGHDEAQGVAAVQRSAEDETRRRQSAAQRARPRLVQKGEE